MTILIGIDIQSIDDVSASIEAFGTRYLERVYTRHEIASCLDDVRSAAQGFADRFAAKEAVMKVLDVSDAPVPWKEIEIQMMSAGQSTITLSGRIAERAMRQGVDKLSLSVSHTERLATAIVVGEVAELQCDGVGHL
jgi:holo-[acyl-carrier protein] synthase